MSSVTTPTGLRIGLAEIKRRTPEGCCIFCGDPARKIRSPRSKRTHFQTCGAEVCRVTGYQRLYKRDYRRRGLDS